MEELEKMCVVNRYYEIAYACSHDTKIINLGWPWSLRTLPCQSCGIVAER